MPEKFTKLFWFIFSIFLLAAMAIFDFKTGDRIDFMIFYLIPVMFSVWLVGRIAAIITAGLSILVWAWINYNSPLSYINLLVPYWTISMGIFFVIFTVFAIELRNSFEKEKKQTRIDHLTGIANRQHFYEAVTKEIVRCRRYKRPFSVAFLDCDNFKYINDNYGHRTGDSLLRILADSISKNVRATDMVARLGGDEFVVLLIETDYNSSKEFMNRFQSLLINIIKANNIPVTFSIGVVTCIEPPNSVEDIINRADELMYSVKKNGKNAVKFDIYEKISSSSETVLDKVPLPTG